MAGLDQSVLTNLDQQFEGHPPVPANVFPQNLIRGLTDKLYEKRKISAIEVQRITKDALAVGDIRRAESIIYVLKHEFCYGAHLNARKGGLIGLAGVAIALDEKISDYVADLMLPMMGCLSDPDSRVRYYACEALYNVAKVGRGGILPFFNETFDKLCKLSADSDANVRNGADLLDRLVKDIVLETTAFDVRAFIPLLKERVYVVNPCARQFIVSWIQALDNVPDIELLDFLHDFLDGLFEILGDPNTEIALMAENQLTEFLREIRATGLDFKASAHIPIRHCASKDKVVQYTALLWVKEFIVLSGVDILPFTSDIIGAILPCLAHSIPRTRDMAIWANQELLHFIEGLDHPSVTYTALDNELVKSVNVLKTEMFSTALETRRASLRWVLMLQAKMPDLLFALVSTLMPALLRSLSDKNTKIVSLSLEALAEFASYAQPSVQDQWRTSDEMPPHIAQYINTTHTHTHTNTPTPTPPSTHTATHTHTHTHTHSGDNRGIEVSTEGQGPDGKETGTSSQRDGFSITDGSRDSITSNTGQDRPTSTGSGTNAHDGRLTDNGVEHMKQAEKGRDDVDDLAQDIDNATLDPKTATTTAKPPLSATDSNTSAIVRDATSTVGSSSTKQGPLNAKLSLSGGKGITSSAAQSSSGGRNGSTPHTGTPPVGMGLVSPLIPGRSPLESGQITPAGTSITPSNDEMSTDFAGFLDRILSLFNDNRKLLAQRGSLIVCQLCNMLSPLRIFYTMADILLNYEDLEFAEHMVFVLNSILLTSVECRELRTRLKDQHLKDNQKFYITLHLTWAHNPVALMSLSLLSSTYHHASTLLPVFGEMEVSVGLLMEIDRLVKLLESPVFTFLRLHLLEPDGYPYLVKSLYGLLMLLPQSQAYHTLRSRLDAIPPVHLLRSVKSPDDGCHSINNLEGVNIRFDRLLAHFKQIQTGHALLNTNDLLHPSTSDVLEAAP